MSATSELLENKFRLHSITRESINNVQELNIRKIEELEVLKRKLQATSNFEEAIIVKQICRKMKELEALIKIVIDNDKLSS